MNIFVATEMFVTVNIYVLSVLGILFSLRIQTFLLKNYIMYLCLKDLQTDEVFWSYYLPC